MSSADQLSKDPAGGGVGGGPQSIKELQASVLIHLEDIFKRNARPDGLWGKEQIEHFVHVEQGEEQPLPKWLADKQTIDFHAFLKYMACPEANWMAPTRKEDLSHPLASYFINSSHNTYLKGNQLSSKCTTQAYTNVLKRGCRCVEIDVWDSKDGDLSSSSDDSSDSSDSEAEGPAGKTKKRSTFSVLRSKFKKLGDSDSSSDEKKTSKPAKTDGVKEKAKKKKIDKRFPAPLGILEPKVYHGYTMTKPVSFRRVCIAILDDAFTATDLPLIVSLEVHCGPDQQEQMVKIMKSIWDGYLIEPPEHEPKVLPSPDELRRKILVKVKYAPHINGGEEQAAEEGQTDDDEVTPPGGKTVKVSKIIHALSDLGVYTRGVSFKSLSAPDSDMPTHIYSLSEKKALEVDAHELFEHNKRYLMRTYPAGTRVTSSNFDPLPRWNKGIQVVALNWQDWDEPMMLNEGMFAGTGGWVLKPHGFHPSDASLPEAKNLDLHITVFAAQNLPLPEADDKAKDFEPYVKCEVHCEHPHGYTAALSSGNEDEHKERTKEREGINPDFRGQALVFKSIVGVMQELAFVRFTVRDDELGRDDLSAWACVRLDKLEQGYRFVHLLDAKGKTTDAALLIKVSKTLR